MQLNIGADQADRWRKNVKPARKPRRVWFSRSTMIWVMIMAVIFHSDRTEGP